MKTGAGFFALGYYRYHRLGRPAFWDILSTLLSASASSSLSQQQSVPGLLARWWVWIPAKLRRYSGLLSAAWSDGFYLNAWPRLAKSLPILMFLIGLFTGATHWGFRIIQEGYTQLFWIGAHYPRLEALLSRHPGLILHSQLAGPAPVSFAQIFSLLLLAAGVGAISANLGLTLVIGYAVGDFFWAGPSQDGIHNYPGVAAHFFHLTIPQLISYLAFFMLAVLPTLNTRIVLLDLIRRGKLERLARLPGRVATALTIALMAAAQGAFVYAWTFVTPMIIRISWTWAGAGSAPINITHFQNVTEVWLPAMAALCVLLRCWLEYCVGTNDGLFASLQNVLEEARAANWQPHTPGALSIWLQAIVAAVLVTVLSIGFLWSITAGLVFLAIVTCIFFARAYALPKRVGWQSWAGVMMKLPVVVRWVAAIAGSYLVTRIVLTIDLRPLHRISPAFKSFTASINDKDPSDFWVELACIIVSLLIALVLLPEGLETGAERSSLKTQRANDPEWLMGMLMLFSIGGVNFCKDPFCCFGASDLLVALMIMALIWMMLPVILPLLGFALNVLGIYGTLEAVWGRDFITGEKLPIWEQVLGILPFGGGLLSRGAKVFKKFPAKLLSVLEDESGAVRIPGGYKYPPRTLPEDIFSGAKKVTPKNGRARWEDDRGYLYEWDSQHGTLEKYNSKGFHMGEFNLEGQQTKPRNPRYRIDP